MKNMIEKIENRTINKYGFENKRTIVIFKLTEVMRKVCKLTD